MFSSRMELAYRVIDLLQEQDNVREVYLRGSLLEDHPDQYSDIDIGVDVSGFDNAQFSFELLSVIQTRFQVVLHDWAPSLLPDQYIQTFFIEGYSAFWSIDIEVVATPHTASINTIQNEPIGHAIKLWLQNAKYYLRNKKNHNIRDFAKRYLGDIDRRDSNTELMMMILSKIKEKSDGQYESLIKKCEAICKDLY